MSAELCGFKRAWTSPCNLPKLEGEEVCSVHIDKKCWCGGQAVKECSVASSFVCGTPTCADHECHCIAAGLTGSHGHAHSKKGREQYLKWREEQDERG